MSTGRKRNIAAAVIIAAASFAFVQLCFGLLPSIFDTWNSQLQDSLFALRSSIPVFKPAYDPTVVHVDINDTALNRLSISYLARSDYARIVRNLASMHTAAQAYDMIFAAETGEAGDASLTSATREAGNAYFGMAFALDRTGQYGKREDSGPAARKYLEETGWKLRVEGEPVPASWTGKSPFLTFPALASSARGLGFLSLRTDRDGVIRRAPLLVMHEGVFYPSLPFRVVCDYLGVGPEKIAVQPGKHVLLQGASRPGGRPHDIAIPIDASGNMIVNFIGAWEAMRHYSFADIYLASDDREELRMWAGELAGRIVLVSDVSTGATDIGPVPVDVNYPLSGMHASVMHTILTENFIRELTPREMLPIELLLLAAIVALSLRPSPLFFSAGSAALAVGYGAAAVLLFLAHGLLLHLVRPLFCAALASSGILLYRYFQDEKEKEALRRTFESYFPPAVVKKVLANPALLDRGSKKELTILFSDIKDFTAHSGSLSPGQVRRLLNEYFEAMVEIVFRYGGTVDKYIGDGLMVFFGDPEPLPDHAFQCVQAAVAMQKRAAALRQSWLKQGGFPIRIRIGVHTGEVIVGNMGSSRRLSYTVLGAAVNLAKRLESEAPPGGILISESTCRLTGGRLEAVSPPVSMHFKGIAEPVSVYTILVDGEEEATTR